MSSGRILAQARHHVFWHESDDERDLNRTSEQQHDATRAVGPAIEYMLQHLKEPLWISSLSSLVGISNSHFFTLFKCATGCGPMKFLNRLRMERACQLLMNRDLCVKQVAAEVGYEDQFYFSRVFKSVTGMAPSEYRQRIIGSGEILSPHGLDRILQNSRIG